MSGSFSTTVNFDVFDFLKRCQRLAALDSVKCQPSSASSSTPLHFYVHPKQAKPSLSFNIASSIVSPPTTNTASTASTTPRPSISASLPSVLSKGLCTRNCEESLRRCCSSSHSSRHHGRSQAKWPIFHERHERFCSIVSWKVV